MAFDGIRLDTAGRVWAAAGLALHCFAPDGALIGKLRLPEPVSNLVFGGPKQNRLFVTASTSVYSLLTTVTGAARPGSAVRMHELHVVDGPGGDRSRVSWKVCAVVTLDPGATHSTRASPW